MISDYTLTQLVRGLIGRRSEGVYWDFKLKHHLNSEDLVHDVLCLANAEHDGPRFLVFGVKDGGTSVQTIKSDKGRRSQSDIAGLFRDNAQKFFQSSRVARGNFTPRPSQIRTCTSPRIRLLPVRQTVVANRPEPSPSGSSRYQLS